MKNLSLSVLSLSLAFALTASATVSADDGLKSGPQSGDKIGAFYVTKIAGAEEDGVKEGKNLCYRCKNGQRPQVMVFTRSTDKKVQELLSKLDKAIDENESSQLRVFVNVLGEDKDDVADSCKKLASSSKAKNIPFVLPNEFENGPDNYGINAKADVTITMASESSVKVSHAFAKAGDLNVDGVIEDLTKILN